MELSRSKSQFHQGKRATFKRAGNVLKLDFHLFYILVNKMWKRWKSSSKNFYRSNLDHTLARPMPDHEHCLSILLSKQRHML